MPLKRISLEDTMKKIIDLIDQEMTAAFEKAGYEASYGKVTLSNRPDLCEYQCNGAMRRRRHTGRLPL